MTEEPLEERCINHKAAHEQLKHELERGKGTSGTTGYRRMGCYDCDGYNKDCAKYIFFDIK